MDLSSEVGRSVDGLYPIPTPTKSRFKEVIDHGAFTHYNRHMKTWNKEEKGLIELEVPSDDGPYDIYENFVLHVPYLEKLRLTVGDTVVWDIKERHEVCFAFDHETDESGEWWSIPLKNLQPLFSHHPLTLHFPSEGTLYASAYRITKLEFNRYLYLNKVVHYESFMFIPLHIDEMNRFVYEFSSLKLVASRLCLWASPVSKIKVKQADLNGLQFWRQGSMEDRMLFGFNRSALSDPIWILETDPMSTTQGTGCYLLEEGKCLNGSVERQPLKSCSESPPLILCICFRQALNGDKYLMGISPWKESEQSYPLTRGDDGSFNEGFWQTKRDTNTEGNELPFPKRSETPIPKEWKAKLHALCIHCDRKGWFTDFFGPSISRLSDKYVGNREYHLNVIGQAWSFPEGVLHYYCEEGVQPSDEFYSLVDSFDYEECDFEGTPHLYI